MFSSEGEKKAAIVVLSLQIVVYIILGMIGIYWLVLGLKVRFLPVLRGRHYRLAFFSSFCLIMALMVFQPLRSGYVFVHDYGSESYLNRVFLLEISSIIYVFSFGGAALSFVARIWLIYFQTHYNLAFSRNKWITIIDKNISSISFYKREQWFINEKNKTKWGSPHWMFGRVCIPTLIILCVVVVVCDYTISEIISRIFFNTFVLLLGSFAVYFWIKVPNYVDHINLKAELRRLLFWYFALVLMGGVYTIVTFMDKHFKRLAYFWYLTIFYVPIACLSFGGAMSSTYKVLKWANLLGFITEHRQEIVDLPVPLGLNINNHDNKDLQKRVTIQFNEYTKTTIRSSIQPSLDEYNSPKSSLSLDDILSNSKKLDIFMEFLFGEFAPENLLGYIELLQFKYYILSDMLGMERTHYILPKDLVKSEIVYSKDQQITLSQKFILLVEKYILDSAPYCLNISYSQRLNLIALYRNRTAQDAMSPQDMSTIFDECIREIHNLMRDSFGRFSGTEMYKHLQQL